MRAFLPGRLATALTLALFAAVVPSTTRAEPLSDCFAVTRDLRDLAHTVAKLKASLDAATPDAKVGIQKQIAEAESSAAHKADPLKDCWYTLHIHAVRVSDSCPGVRPADVNPDQVTRWVAAANTVYAAAHVRFEFDPTPKKGDWAELNDSEVNDLVAEMPGDPVWEKGRAAANQLAARYPGKVLVLFRHGPDAKPAGGAFSSDAYSFVVMPGFEATTLCGENQNLYLLAHEMGHYFGLKHTFRQFKTRAEALTALKRAGNKPAAFDGDGLAETPPEPYIEELQCGKDPIVILNGIPFPLLRNNIMSYYASDAKTLTPAQVGIVRAWVERRFARAMDPIGPVVPDERRSYQVVALVSGKVLQVEPTPRSGKVGVADWNGGTNQSWRFVPLTAQDTGWFEVVSGAGTQCLTVADGSASEGAPLAMADWAGDNSQKWRLIRDDDGQLFIEAKHTRKVLSVAPSARTAAARTPGVPVTQVENKGGTTQRWQLLPLD